MKKGASVFFILVDETSSNDLFNHFVNFQKSAARECVPILCIDEGYTFLSKLISMSKSASLYLSDNGAYDGDYWYSIKGKGKRVGVQSACMSMAPFHAAEYQLKKKVTVILRLHTLPKKDARSFPSNMYM